MIDLFLISLTLAEIGLFIYKPRIGLLLFFSTKFTADLFWNHSLLGLHVNILQIHGVLFFILCVVLCIRFKTLITRHPLRKILIALLISNIAASAWGFLNSHFVFFELVASPLSLPHIAEWNIRFLNLAGAFVFIPVVFNQKNDFRLIIKVFTIATIIPVILGMTEFADKLSSSQLLTEAGYSVRQFPRITAGYHDSAVLAIILFAGLFGSFYLFYTEALHKFKWIYFTYFLIILFLLYHTYSRTLWLTAALFFILFFLYQKKYLPTLVILLILIISAVSLPAVQKRFRQEISYLKQENTEFLTFDMTGTGRVGLWKIAADHYRRLDLISKLIGSGGAYGSHNQFIAFLLKNGLIGLIFFFIFLYYLYKKLIQTRSMLQQTRTPPRYALVLGLLVSSVFIANQFIQLWDHITYNYFFWSLTGILIHPPPEQSQTNESMHNN